MATPARVIGSTPYFWVRGEASEPLHRLLLSAEILADESGMSSLEAVFHNWDGRASDAEGFPLFDGTVGLGNPVSVAFASDDRGDQADVVFLGIITAVEGVFRESRSPMLRLRAEDAFWALRMTRHTRVHEEATDAEIAQRVGAELGLRVDAEAEGPTHRELLAVNQSDLAFLRERARAVDAALSVDHSGLQLRRRGPSAEPPIPLSRASLRSLEIHADLAHQRTEVQVHGWSVADKEGIHAGGSLPALAGERTSGKTGAEILEGMGLHAVEHHALELPSTHGEAQTLAESLFRERARRFVTARGSMDGDPRVRVGVELEIVDVGPWFTGKYRVVSLRHSFVEGRFETHFVATRPTLGGGL